jgi:hypothetical protein
MAVQYYDAHSGSISQKSRSGQNFITQIGVGEIGLVPEKNNKKFYVFSAFFAAFIGFELNRFAEPEGKFEV